MNCWRRSENDILISEENCDRRWEFGYFHCNFKTENSLRLDIEIRVSQPGSTKHLQSATHAQIS